MNKTCLEIDMEWKMELEDEGKEELKWLKLGRWFTPLGR